MNAKISVFVICVEAIIYLLLYDLHDCTFNGNTNNYPCFMVTGKTKQELTADWDYVQRQR